VVSSPPMVARRNPSGLDEHVPRPRRSSGRCRTTSEPLADAERLTPKCWRRARHVDARHLLGVLALKRRRPRPQSTSHRDRDPRAAARRPRRPTPPYHQARQCPPGVRPDRGGVAAYRRAIAPTRSAHAHSNSANVLQARGTSTARSRATRGPAARAHTCRLTTTWATLSGSAERSGERQLSHGLRVRPDYAEAFNNLANLLQTAIGSTSDRCLRGARAGADAPRCWSISHRAAPGRADRRGGRPIRRRWRSTPTMPRPTSTGHARLPGLRRRAPRPLRPRRGAAPDYAERITISPAAEGGGRVRAGIRAPAAGAGGRPDMVDARQPANLLQEPGPLDDAVETWRRLLELAPITPRPSSCSQRVAAAGAQCRRLATLPRALAINRGSPRRNTTTPHLQTTPGDARARALRAPVTLRRTMSRRTGPPLALLVSGDSDRRLAGIRMALAPGLLREAGAPVDQPLWRGSRLPQAHPAHAEQGLGDTCSSAAMPPGRGAGARRDHPRGAPALSGSWRQPGGDAPIVPWIRVPDATACRLRPHCPLMSCRWRSRPRSTASGGDAVSARQPGQAAAGSAGCDDRGFRSGSCGPAHPANDPQAIATDRGAASRWPSWRARRVAGVSWYSLRKRAGRAGARTAGRLALIDLMASPGFRRHRALVAQLDLVISVDTAVAPSRGGATSRWLLSRSTLLRWLLGGTTARGIRRAALPPGRGRRLGAGD